MSSLQRLPVKGMTCEHCEKTVTEALTAAGARNVRASYRKGEAVLDTGGVQESELRAALEQVGYRAGRLEPIAEAPAAPKVVRGEGKHGYDLAVIGSGSAAFAAAIRARDLEARVALIEANTVGGTCVNVGCVPSKAMLAAAEAYDRARSNPFPGIATQATGVDLKAAVDAKNELVESLRQSKYLDLAESYGFDLVRGEASFHDVHTLAVDGRSIRAGAILIASGASPAIPPIPGLAEAGYLTSTTALELTELPQHLIVIGANAVGLEMGQLFLHLGARVTFLDMAPRIAPGEEPEISEVLADVLREEGAEINTGVQVLRVSRMGNERTVHFRVGSRERAATGTHILVATGRRPNISELGLHRVGVAVTDKGAVKVDETLRTTAPTIFGAGDAAGFPQFVYVAARSGALAADNALNNGHLKLDLSALPRITFTRPQIASAGLTDEQANAHGYACECRTMPLDAVPRALVNRDTRGLFKMVAERETGKLLGVSILAENAGDVILSAVYALQFGATVQQLADSWGPYLTMGEGMKLVAQTYTRDIAKLSCCAA